MSKDEATTIRDQGVRDRIINATDTSLLVEAAAGTGKTTLMVERILQGVREGRLRLPGVVAITFTEKAAGELEERLRRKLTELLGRRELPPHEHRRFRRAVQELDRARISTIHSFCAQLLRERPADAGVDPAFDVLDGTAAELLRAECWRDWIDEQAGADTPPLVEALRAGLDGGALRTLAEALTEAPEILELDSFQLPAGGASVDEHLAAFKNAASDVSHASEAHMRGRGNPQSRELRSLSGAVEAEDDTLRLRRLAYRAATIDVETAVKSFGKKRDEVRPLFEEFVAPARRIGAGLAGDVFLWVSGFVRYYTRAKAERSALDFQDLLLRTARMLRNKPRVRRYFQRRYKAFFVDEFQDTDPLQAELIAYLCEAPGPAADRMSEVRLRDGALLAVGDPKQSIYRFRRADVLVYEQFKQLFGPDRTEHIYCNFRSVSPLLGWFNRLFEKVFGSPEREGVYQAEHVPLEAGLARQRTAGPAAVALCPPPGEPVKEWRSPAARRHEAAYLARAVRASVDGGLALPGAPDGLSYGSFAFLFRALTDVDIYEEALEAEGVPYRVLGGKHFYSRSQTAETLAMLRAVDDPLDHVSIAAALRSSYFGLSDEDLLRYAAGDGGWNYLRPLPADGPVAEALGRLRGWHRQRNRVPPHVLLRRILAETKATAAYRLKPAGRQRAAVLDQLRRRLRSLSKTARTFGAVVRHLSSLEEAGLSEEEASSVEPDDDFVQLLSMHKAKGLQFPVVALPDLFRGLVSGGNRQPLLFDRTTGEVGVCLGSGVETANYDELAAVEKENELAELRRLFYVACTRAESVLMLPLHWCRRGRKPNFQSMLEETGRLTGADEVPFGGVQEGVHYLDTRGWSEEVDVTARRRGLPEQPPEEASPLLRQRERWQRDHAALVSRAAQTVRFVHPSELDGRTEGAPADVTAAADGPTGREVGTLFHDLMARLRFEGGAPETADVERLAAALAAGSGLPDRMAQKAARLADKAFQKPEFTDLLVSADWLAREVSFTVPLSELPAPSAQDGWVEGSIDLLASRRGRAVILDYKTDRALQPARYWPQIALYALAAQAAGRIIEGDVELVLFFVRQGEFCTRSLDDEVRAEVIRYLTERPV